MYLIHNCLGCKSDNVSFESAYFARFVAWRAVGRPFPKDRLISVVVCHDCSYVGTSVRLDKEEMARLYKDYRGEEYNRLRIELEPYYAEIAGKFDTQNEIERRSVGINQLIDRHIQTDMVTTVLDYGGGKGQFIPAKFSRAKKYVYDISDAPLCEGVERFNPKEDRTFDFLMCCHVIEHESEPDELMTDLFKFAHKDTLLYFEVPNYDCPWIPNGVFHEHQSIFNMQSMTTFLQRHRLNIVDTVQCYDYIGFLTYRQLED